MAALPVPARLAAEVTTVPAPWSQRRSALRPNTIAFNVKLFIFVQSYWQILSTSFRDLGDFITLCTLLPLEVAANAIVADAIKSVRSNWGTEWGATRLGGLLNELIQLHLTHEESQIAGVRDFLGLEHALRVIEYTRNRRGGPDARASAADVFDGFRIAAMMPVARPAYGYDEICVILWNPLDGQMYAAARRYSDFYNAKTVAEQLPRRLTLEDRDWIGAPTAALAPFPPKQPWWRSRSAVTAERIPLLNAWLESVAAVPALRNRVLFPLLGKDDWFVY